VIVDVMRVRQYRTSCPSTQKSAYITAGSGLEAWPIRHQCKNYSGDQTAV